MYHMHVEVVIYIYVNSNGFLVGIMSSTHLVSKDKMFHMNYKNVFNLPFRKKWLECTYKSRNVHEKWFHQRTA